MGNAGFEKENDGCTLPLPLPPPLSLLLLLPPPPLPCATAAAVVTARWDRAGEASTAAAAVRAEARAAPPSEHSSGASRTRPGLLPRRPSPHPELCCPVFRVHIQRIFSIQ